MKSFLLVSAITVSLFSASSVSVAGHQRHDNRHHYDDNARVIHVKPIFSSKRITTPYRDCGYKKQHRDDRYRHYSSAVLGGLAGGIIGNQFGKGSGKTAMTIAGTVIGSTVAYQLGYDANNNHYKKYDNGCKTSHRYHKEKKIDGYLVRYRYQGRTYTTRMNHRPGKYIPINVTVRPIGRFY